MAATLDAQRPVLSHGLRAGRRNVSVRALGPVDQSSSVWYPASCGRRPTIPSAPCRDAAPDSGHFPLVLLGSAGRASQDTVRAAYFASHGYVVVVTTSFEEAWRGARDLPFVDSTRLAVVGAGAGMAAARDFARSVDAVDALAELGADSGDPPPGIVGRIPVLSWLSPTAEAAPAADDRLAVRLPPGPSDHVRLITAVTHAFLNAALERGSRTLADLATRLRQAGLVVARR